MPVKTRNAPNTTSSHQKREMRAVPAKMKIARSARAPKMPQNSTRCWNLSGMAIVANNIAHTKTLSTLSDFSIR